MMYTLARVIGALINLYRLGKSSNIDNIEIYIDVMSVLDEYHPDVKNGIIETFANGSFASMTEKKLLNYKSLLEDITRRLNGEADRRLVGLEQPSSKIQAEEKDWEDWGEEESQEETTWDTW